MTVTVVPLLTEVVVFVADGTLGVEFEFSVSEIVAASSVTTPVVVLAEVVVLATVVVVDELEDPVDESEAFSTVVEEVLVADPDDASGASVSFPTAVVEF